MMKNTKIITALGLMGILLWGTGLPVADAKQAEPAAQSQQAPAANASQAVNSYVYTSQKYGYTIDCPQKPHVIPASELYEGKQGEVLIFASEGYNIRNAWIVIKDAFAEDKMPNLNTISEDEAKKYLNALMSSNGYEGIMLINRTAQDKAIYAITAKEVEIDTDGDGQPDTTAKSDTQMAVTFFRGNKGGRYSVQLIDNPDLRSTALDAFQKGVVSFKEN